MSVDILNRFAQWVRSDSAEYNFSTTTTIDTYYEVGETSQSIDFGALGEREIDVYVGEVNVYLEDYDVEGTESIDIEGFVNAFSPVSARALLDAIEDAVTALGATSGAVIPTALNVREEQAGRAALAAVSVFLDGDGEEALRRALGDALTRAGFAGGIGQVFSTVSDVRTDQLRPGDVLIRTDGGGNDGERACGGTFVSSRPDGQGVPLIRVTLTKDGETVEVSFNDYRLWEVSRPVSGTVAGLGYDPLTVPVRYSVSPGTKVSDLRLGDDVIGFEFGRVVRIESVDGERVRLVLNRDGTENVKDVRRDTRYSFLDIAPEGIERSEVPTALALFERSQSTAVAF